MNSETTSAWKVACFDLDGTLVRDTSTGQHLAEEIGHSKKMQEIEVLYRMGKVSNADVAALDGKYYNGYTVTDIHHFLEDAPTIDHISETVTFLSSKGISSLVCTLAWEFVAEFFAKKYGFVGWSDPVLFTEQNGAFTGNVMSNYHETDKPPFVTNYCRKNDIKMSEVFHVGDSRSDIPLFNAVGFSIAFNGDNSAKLAASVSIERDSLRDILPLIPGLKS